MSTFAGVTGIGHNKPYHGDALAALGLGFANFTNSIIIRHPCVVLRRQCQVNDYALQKHFTPFTLLPIVVKLSVKDGFLSLWKGAVGSGVLWAFSRVSELVIAELFGLPTSFVPDGSSERFWRHVWLKASNNIVCTPVIIASFAETVRTGAGLAEDIHLLEVISRGFERFYQDLLVGNGPVADRRRHSIIWLAIPTSLYQTVHFLICRYVYAKAYAWSRAYVSRKMPSDRKRYHTIMPELLSTITSVFVADLLCYPLETVLHRLYIQGTRTLVDNLDYGSSALVPAARYGGLFDCFTTIVRKEGFWALFSGVGAVFLQYALQHALASLVYWALDRGSAGYTAGGLRIKRSTLEYTGELGNTNSDGASTSAAANSPRPFAHHQHSASPQNPTSGSRQSTSSQQTSSSVLFPSFAQTQQSGGGQIDNSNNPFMAALRQHKSGGTTMAPMDNTSTLSSPTGPSSPYSAVQSEDR